MFELSTQPVMSALLLTLKSQTSTLSIDFQPPIQLNPDYTYGLSLLSFHSYNSIPNIDDGSKFYVKDSKGIETIITLPEGSYEIGDIEAHIKQVLGVVKDDEFSLKPNNNTLKCEIRSSNYSVDFQQPNGIGHLLGFSSRLLASGPLHTSDKPVNIIKVRTIHIDSNITSGAFYNDKPSHTIYEFAVGVDPGFAIDETPQHLIYLPVINRREIHNITLKVLDQNSNLINFRGEDLIIRLELKQNGVTTGFY